MSDNVELHNDSDPDFMVTNKLPKKSEFIVILAQQIRAYGSVDFTINSLEQMVKTSLQKSGLSLKED